MKVNIYIPTLNAGQKWQETITMLRRQTFPVSRTIIIDSGSTDGTLSQNFIQGFDVLHLDKRDFDHGGTRHMAVEKFPDADIYLFLTQDAIPADEQVIENMVRAFELNPKLGMVYGRQLPHRGAKPLEAHARLFNYPAESQVKSLEDAGTYGIKTISCSNSFAAYRRTAYWEAGGFPSGTILGEDVIIAGRMLLKGWQKAYLAEASVYHSHDYSLKEEFRRYFDIGVFHSSNSWIFDHFGRAESEGLKYLKSEMNYIFKNNVAVLPKSATSILCKWLGYKMGLNYNKLPLAVNKRLSMHKAYWNH
ncbi:MAG TPA: glycosyltransferase [Cyclobacteriaceae bacterium]|nr:glycosyltransferase [Cyclobacteriaceae bacterium]